MEKAKLNYMSAVDKKDAKEKVLVKANELYRLSKQIIEKCENNISKEKFEDDSYYYAKTLTKRKETNK